MIYFDNAATSWPKPDAVYKAVFDSMKNYGANPGRSGHRLSLKAAEKVYECREALSDFFGLDNPSGVIFTQNATHSLNIVINGILKKGDHAICTVMDHNSVLRPMFARIPDVECTFVGADSEGYVGFEMVEKEIKPNTVLVVMTHVSNVCGTINPIEKVANICRQRNIAFMVDASQSAGIVNINMKKENIDFLAAPGHKALYGPMGTGILCINTDSLPEPLMYGGTGSYSKELSQPVELPDYYESGTLNMPGICGLREGIRFIEKRGHDSILQYEKKLTQFLIDGLSEFKDINILGKKDIYGRCAVVSFVHNKLDSSNLSTILDSKYSVCVRPMYHCAYKAHEALGSSIGGAVRVSFGAFNKIDEVKRFLYALNHL